MTVQRAKRDPLYFSEVPSQDVERGPANGSTRTHPLRRPHAVSSTPASAPTLAPVSFPDPRPAPAPAFTPDYISAPNLNLEPLSEAI